MNAYHYIVIAILTAGIFSPLLDKNLKSYQKRKALKLNIVVIGLIIFLIYKSSK
jgi:hypothetical protein